MAKKKKKNKKQYVAFILDESASMGFLTSEIIDAFNDNVEEIRESSQDIETSVTLTKFGSKAKIEIFDEDVDCLEKIDRETYSPHGMTAMYDGIGMTVDKLMKLKDIDDKETSVLIIIFSDGHENNSRAYDSAGIAERVQELEGTERWSFLYVGANQDLAQVSSNLGIAVGNMMTFDASSKGVSASSDRTRIGIKNYFNCRIGGQTATRCFYSDGESIADAEDEG